MLTFTLAVLLGLFCASSEGSAADRIICRVGTATSVIPSFFTALAAILVFGVNLKLLPTGGAYSIGGGGAADRALHLIMPVGVSMLSHLWYYAYIVRNRVIEELRKDYVLLLRVKRISETRILLRHCLRNALPMLVTLMTLSVPHILAGTYIVEKVFGYPGFGTLTFESAAYKDYNMLSALTLLTGLTVLVSNLAGQALTEALDRRMRGTEDAGSRFARVSRIGKPYERDEDAGSRFARGSRIGRPQERDEDAGSRFAQVSRIGKPQERDEDAAND
jgi:peptide/nickel transport system permease protein